MEVFEPSTPFEAWAFEVTRARVADDGRLELWRCNGHWGGEMRVVDTNGDWEKRVREFMDRRIG